MSHKTENCVGPKVVARVDRKSLAEDTRIQESDKSNAVVLFVVFPVSLGASVVQELRKDLRVEGKKVGDVYVSLSQQIRPARARSISKLGCHWLAVLKHTIPVLQSYSTKRPDSNILFNTT